MRALVMRVAGERLRGERPAPPRALLAASAAGAAAAVITYRVLRG